MTSRCLGHRAPLLWLIVPWISGVVCARVANPSSASIWLCIAVAASGVAIASAHCTRLLRVWGFSVILAAVCAGAAAFALHRNRLPDWASRPPREAHLELRVKRVSFREPDVASGFGVVLAGSGSHRDLAGQRIHFALRLRDGQTAPLRSAVIRCRGLLSPLPETAPSGTFERYLIDGGANFRLVRARLMETRQGPSAYHVFLDRANHRLSGWLSQGIGGERPDLVAVYRAMVMGQTRDLTQEQDEVFIRSGTMHLFSISGLHIAVIAGSLRALLALLRFPRLLSGALMLTAVWFHVDVTGASPSAVRAFLLVACYEAAFMLRRPPNAIAAVSTAALVVLVYDPLSLFSASFQMSYGVVLAILCLGLPLAERLESRLTPFRSLPPAFHSWWQRWLLHLLRKGWSAVAIGFAATLVSAVTGPTFFEVVAPGGFLTNLALIPVATVALVAGLACIIAGAIGLAPVCVLFNHAALVVLWIIDALVRLAVSLPAAWSPAHWRAEWCAPTFLLLLLATIVGGYATRWQRSTGGWWPPVAIVAVALVFGADFS